MTTPTPGQPLSEADVLPCTDCDGTGITTQSERPCSCSAGDAYRPHAPVSRPGDGVAGESKRAAIMREVKAYAARDDVGSVWWVNALTGRIMEVTK